MKNWFKRLLHKFDVLCPECGGVRILPWHSTCGFCDEGEGRMK